MNVIKKYWDSVYIYVLLSIPSFCIAAGLFWTIFKILGHYPELEWRHVIIFDLSQLIYMGIAVYFIIKNKKDSSYIPTHLTLIKTFIILILLIQYNFLIYLFPSYHMWECTFVFLAICTFFFDEKMMTVNITGYTISFIAACVKNPVLFLPADGTNLPEFIAFRIIVYFIVCLSIMLIIKFVNKFILQAQINREENIHLLEKQVEYYKHTELMDRELRKFRHDIKNHFICMEHLLEHHEFAKLEEYFASLQYSFSTRNKMYFSGNIIIDSILNYELSKNHLGNAAVSVHGNLDTINSIEPIDLCNIFSNMLSNAINSVNKCDFNNSPHLSIQFKTGKKYFSISISNETIADLPTDKELKKRQKKDRNHGYGLVKIKELTQKYNGTFEQNISNNIVTTAVYLPI